MKRRPIITILAVAMILMLSLSVFTACGKNKHKFSDEWKSDESGHWHECMTKKHTDVADKADHTFDAGVVTTPASETAKGVMTFTCTVCKYQKTKILDKLEHVHTFDMDNWERDDENHWHPATCGHTEVKKDLAAHTWNEGVITTPATETEEGVKTYTCTICGKTKTAPIGRLDHVHTFDMDTWKHDAENHWHPATCGHTDEKKDFASHVWNEGVVTKPADYGVEGEKTFTCTVCKATRTEPITALEAKDNEIVLQDGKTLDKTYDGSAVDVSDKFSFNGNGEVTFMFKAKGADDNTYAATAPKNAGEYTVKVGVEGTAEWKAATKTFDFAIAKKELTGAAATKVYDGNVTIEATPDGVVAGDAVTATITMTSKDVGATVQSVMLEGADKDNYVIDKTKVTASITKKDITKDIPHMNYFYNATTSLFLYNGSTGGYGTINGDAVIIRIIFESKDVGTTNITGVSISGTDGGNYYIDHTKLSGTIIQTSLDLVGINFKIFKFGDNYYSVPLKVTEDHVMDEFNEDVTIKMIKYNGTHAIGETWTLTNADSDCFEITGADAKNYKKVIFSDDEDLACTATLAVDESMPELTDDVYNKDLKVGTYWYKKELGAGNWTLDYYKSKMKITVYKPDGKEATVITDEIFVSEKTTIYFYVVATEEAFRGPRVFKSSTTFAELTIGTTYSLPKGVTGNNSDKKYLLKVSLPQNGYYQITKQRYSLKHISFYDEQGKQITPLKCTNRTYDSVNDTYSDYIYTFANFSDSVKVVYIATYTDKDIDNGITVSSAKSYTVSETGKYLRYETKYLSAQLDAGKITINENNSTVPSERKLTYKVYDADLNEIKMTDGIFDIPAKGKYLIEVSNLTTADIESVTFRIVAA